MSNTLRNTLILALFSDMVDERIASAMCGSAPDIIIRDRVRNAIDSALQEMYPASPSPACAPVEIPGPSNTDNGPDPSGPAPLDADTMQSYRACAEANGIDPETVGDFADACARAHALGIYPSNVESAVSEGLLWYDYESCEVRFSGEAYDGDDDGPDDDDDDDDDGYFRD